MASRLPVEAPEGTAARPMTPDSSRTSVSMVGLPRESSISLAMTSTMALIVIPIVGVVYFLLLEHVFCARAALDQAIELLEVLEQRPHELQRPGVGSVGKRLGGVRMRFHEQARDACGYGRARQHRHGFTLSPACGALPAGKLNGVRGVKHHWTAGVAHDHERAHV